MADRDPGLELTHRAVDRIAERLYRAGCRHAFGIPGGEVLSMMAALDRAGIAFTLAKHENCAGYMAEGTYHATCAPGILLATIGPGVTNGVNAVANAFQDKVPLVMLAGRVSEVEALAYTHQVIDHRAILDPITKATFTATPGGIAAMIDKAVAIALDGQPGPVFIDIPVSIADAEEVASAPPDRTRPAPVAPALGPALDRARQAFATARRPVMIAGVDAMHQGAAPAIRACVERFGIPLLTSYKAKGLLAEDHPLSLGGHGLSPKADALVMPFLAEADLIILAGYDPVEMRAGWRDPWAPEVAIEFSPVPNTHYMHRADLAFVCDVAAGLAALSEDQQPQPVWRREPAALRSALAQAFAPEPSGWGPAAICAALRRALPREAMLTTDSGAHRILLSQMWECYAPRGLMQSSAFCTMGCSLPLAIGYKRARPDAPVAVLVGDACLEMTLGELATARDLGLGIPIIVLVDESLALIELKQRGRQMPALGVDFPMTDFAAVAGALGGVGVTVNDTEALEAAVRDSLNRQTFTLIACPIGRRAYDGKI